MYGEFCGKTLPRSFSFYHGKALMMFSSDKTKTEAGFSLAYEGTFLGCNDWRIMFVYFAWNGDLDIWTYAVFLKLDPRLLNIPLICLMQEVNKMQNHAIIEIRACHFSWTVSFWSFGFFFVDWLPCEYLYTSNLLGMQAYEWRAPTKSTKIELHCTNMNEAILQT